MPRVANSAFVLMFSYYPPSGGRGISLGLVRQYRCAYSAPSSGVGTPTPRSIALGSKNPRLYLSCSRCVRSLRLLSVSGLLACSRSHLSAAPFAFVPRLLEPPSALQLPPPAVSISLPLYWYIVANPLARAGLGPAFPSEIPARLMASILCMRLSLVRRMGQPRETRLRVVCISHFTSDFLPPCTQIQMRVYSTAFPVFPTCWIFPSFSNAERYRVAVASETCRSFSTSSLVTRGEPVEPFLALASRNSRIFSSFLCFRS